MDGCFQKHERYRARLRYITYFVKVSFLQAKYLLDSERFVFRRVRLVILSSIGCFHEQRAFIVFSSSPSNKDKPRALLCIYVILLKHAN